MLNFTHPTLSALLHSDILVLSIISVLVFM